MCDCDGALLCALNYQQRPTVSHPNFNILWLIFDLRKQIKLRMECIEVKDRQDSAGLGRPLTRLEN